MEEGSAEDYYMSFVEPSITLDGRFVQPTKNGKHWYVGDVAISPYMAECSPAELYAEGFGTFSPLLVVAAVIVAFNSVKRLIWTGE